MKWDSSEVSAIISHQINHSTRDIFPIYNAPNKSMKEFSLTFFDDDQIWMNFREIPMNSKLRWHCQSFHLPFDFMLFFFSASQLLTHSRHFSEIEKYYNSIVNNFLEHQDFFPFKYSKWLNQQFQSSQLALNLAALFTLQISHFSFDIDEFST